MSIIHVQRNTMNHTMFNASVVQPDNPVHKYYHIAEVVRTPQDKLLVWYFRPGEPIPDVYIRQIKKGIEQLPIHPEGIKDFVRFVKPEDV